MFKLLFLIILTFFIKLDLNLYANRKFKIEEYAKQRSQNIIFNTGLAEKQLAREQWVKNSENIRLIQKVFDEHDLKQLDKRLKNSQKEMKFIHKEEKEFIKLNIKYRQKLQRLRDKLSRDELRASLFR